MSWSNTHGKKRRKQQTKTDTNNSAEDQLDELLIEIYCTVSSSRGARPPALFQLSNRLAKPVDASTNVSPKDFFLLGLLSTQNRFEEKENLVAFLRPSSKPEPAFPWPEFFVKC